MGSLNCRQTDQSSRQTNRQTPKQTDSPLDRHSEYRQCGEKPGRSWLLKGFTRWFLILRKTLTKTGLDSGCKPIGFPSAPRPGFFTFSSFTLVEHGCPQGRPSTFEAVW